MRLKFALIFFIFIVAVGACRAKAPTIGIVVNPDPVLQGRTFVVKVFGAGEASALHAEIFGLSAPLFRRSDHYVGLIGVPLGTAPGGHRLRIVISSKAGTIEHDRTVTVQKGWFEKASYWLGPSKTKLLDPGIIAKGWSRIHAEVVKATPEKLWKGPFRRPTIGTVSMRFGARQFINGVQRDQHKGLDIAGMSNYRVRAANYGRVVLAGPQEAFGNTIVIDHGLGVYSLYFHLSRIDVKKGDLVPKGHILGLMGMTGVATGVHLHFAVSVNDVRVDPVQWMNSGIIQ